MMKNYNILLVGVGGQGILTMFKILGNSARVCGFNVNGAETHGMSQRGGSVYVHLRFGTDEIYSPLIMERQADLIVSLEPTEALRFAQFVKPKNGMIITSVNPIEPPNLPLTRNMYPDIDDISKSLSQYCQNVMVIDFKEALGDIGLRSLNIAMLGVLSQIQTFPIPSHELKNEIKLKLKRFWDEANQAFTIGESINVKSYITQS